MKNKIYLIPAIIATLALILCIALKPIKAKANSLQDNTIYFKNTEGVFQNYTTNWNEVYSGWFVWYEYNNFNASSLVFMGNVFNRNYWLHESVNIYCDVYFVQNMTGPQLADINDEDIFMTKLEELAQVAGTDTGNCYGACNIDQKIYNGCLVVRYKANVWEDYGTYDLPFIFLSSDKLESVVMGYSETEMLQQNKYNYDFGYANGVNDGMDWGYQDGYEECLDDLHRAGGDYQFGYDAGKEAGIKSNSIKLGQVISSIFNGMSNFLNIKVFGDFTLGALLTLPIVFGAIWIVLKIIRG